MLRKLYFISYFWPCCYISWNAILMERAEKGSFYSNPEYSLEASITCNLILKLMLSEINSSIDSYQTPTPLQLRQIPWSIWRTLFEHCDCYLLGRVSSTTSCEFHSVVINFRFWSQIISLLIHWSPVTRTTLKQSQQYTLIMRVRWYQKEIVQEPAIHL